ncbi:hypothetical protein [Desulfosporosinus youngiae]|uniref:Uncharacterized protein n=1 Tax=Desulfosporosinus youngiae DSM 17734 TaxID=768710 RepID=H5Y3V7_9FIRM|nr:hypothetical protein [Desulfosporosinus youngiae]EHQ89495.1 hypothetical protein DesyoDRAFT_2420 [Desulfosporosinus youngiae DSM 17734]
MKFEHYLPGNESCNLQKDLFWVRTKLPLQTTSAFTPYDNREQLSPISPLRGSAIGGGGGGGGGGRP